MTSHDRARGQLDVPTLIGVSPGAQKSQKYSEPVSPDDGVERRGLEDEPLRQPDGGRPNPGKVLTGSRQRVRRVSSWIVLVVACLLAVTSVLVVFVRDQVLDTDTYVATVQPLASDPTVQTAVADVVNARLLASTDLERQVANALPGSAGFLVTPISAGLKTVVQQTTLRFVESDAFRALWTTLNRGAHRQLVALLTGSAVGPISTDRGQVRVDLGKVVDQVRRQLDATGITVFDRVATGGGPQFVLFQSTQLERLQGLIRTLDRLALLLPIVTLVLFAVGVLLSVDRRRGLVRAAMGLAIAMAGLVAAFAVGRHYYLDALSGATPHNAAAASYDIVARVPLATVRTILGVSVAAALVGMAMGSRSFRTWVRAVWPPQWLENGQLRRLAVYAPRLALALFGIGMFVIVIWSDVAAGLLIVVVAGLIGLVDRRRSAPDPGTDPGTDLDPGTDPGIDPDADSAKVAPDEATKVATRP